MAFKCTTSKSSVGSGGAAKGAKGFARGGKSGAVEGGPTPADAAPKGECLGAEMLLGLLKNYARSRNLKTAVTARTAPSRCAPCACGDAHGAPA